MDASARDPVSAARASLLRGAAFYAALLAGLLVFIAFVAANAAGAGGWITVALAGAFALLVGWFDVQHLRDLRAAPVERHGIVTRVWSRADLIIAMQSHYVTVDRTVFRVRAEDALYLRELMPVRVVHFPHTLHVVSIEPESRAP
jgi:hypothetical protein